MHPAGGAFAEVVFHILGSFADELDVFEVSLDRRLFGRGVDSFMVVVFNPVPESEVQRLEACVLFHKRQELGAQGLEPALDLSSSFRLIRPGVDKRYAQRGCAAV